MEFLTHCQQIAQKFFGIPKLHSAQESVFALLVQKKYVLATLPTGSGKTLLYAIPSLIFEEGPVLVISPLIALMRDQMRRMKKANIASVIFTGDQTEDERKKSYQDLWSQNTKLIFISPERFVLPAFLEKIAQIKPSMIVIDEAHCVVSWGHQFRPEYSELSKHIATLNPPHILALTATASASTREDMIKKIFPEKLHVSQFVSKPIGSHITVKSWRAFSFEEQKERLFESLNATQSKKCIVYFSTRKQCEEFAMLLKRKQFTTVVYHAGLSKDMRLRIEQYIHNTDSKIIICATTAFGLGVDIPDVTLVVVYGFPSNIEEFLQMIGRAGRSGQPSEGILIWTGSDPIKRLLQFKDYFPTKSEFNSHCEIIRSQFPQQQGESRYLSTDSLQKLLFTKSSTRKSANKVEGFIGALRVCNGVTESILNHDYYEIKLSKNTTLSDLIQELPSTPTKRSKVLRSIQTLIQPELCQKTALEIVLPVKKLLSSSQLSSDSYLEVFQYYTIQGLISFARLDFNQMKLGVILKDEIKMIHSHLPQYLKVRENFYSSLNELKKFAEAPRCRLESSFAYFKVPEMSHEPQRCLQCDLCATYTRIRCKK